MLIFLTYWGLSHALSSLTEWLLIAIMIIGVAYMFGGVSKRLAMKVATGTKSVSVKIAKKTGGFLWKGLQWFIKWLYAFFYRILAKHMSAKAAKLLAIAITVIII